MTKNSSNSVPLVALNFFVTAFGSQESWLACLFFGMAAKDAESIKHLCLVMINEMSAGCNTG